MSVLVQRIDRVLGQRRRALWSLAAQHAVFAVVPVVFTLWEIKYSIHRHSFAIDFDHEFWPAAHRLLDGVTPYDRSWMHIYYGVAFPYPAFTAVAFVPFALLAHGVANWVFTGLNIALAPLTLWVLRVRDWRLYGLTMILWPVILAWEAANLTLVLAFGIAILWRKRDHPAAAGILVAVMISLKPFVWPVALWLVATRRYRALGYAAASGFAINAVSWGLVGFNQIHAYTALTSAVNHVMDRRGYSIFSFVLRLGGSHTLAYALGITVAVAVAVGCLIIGRRGDTKGALALAIAECLLATPVIWTHYFAVMIIPLALYRPRLDFAWLPMLLLYACPGDVPTVWQVPVGLVVSGGVIAWLLLARDPAARATGSRGVSSRPRRPRALTT